MRTIEKEDIEFLRDNINNAEIRSHITDRKPVNMEQERGFFEEVISSDDDVHLAICKDEEMVGINSLGEKLEDEYYE